MTPVGDPGQAFTAITGRDQASSTNKLETKFERIFESAFSH